MGSAGEETCLANGVIRPPEHADRRDKDTERRGAPGSQGRSPGHGAGERPDPLLTGAEREAMYYCALAQMAQITDVHGAIGAGDSSQIERIDRMFAEDRLLVDALSHPAGKCEPIFRSTRSRLRPALERLRETAALADQAERAALITATCARLLLADSPPL
jgi:hypothetical protein